MSVPSPAATSSRSTKRSAAAAGFPSPSQLLQPSQPAPDVAHVQAVVTAAQQFVSTNPDSGANHVINLLCALLSSKLCDVSTQPPSSELSAHELERPRSIVIAGLPEAPSDLCSADRNSLEAFTADIADTSRFGPAGAAAGRGRSAAPAVTATPTTARDFCRDRPRLLEVVLTTRSMQRAFLAAARHLRLDPDFKDVFVRSSLTRQQRDAEYKLRQDCRRRRDAAEKVHIYRGQIIQSGNLQRQPSNRS